VSSANEAKLFGDTKIARALGDGRMWAFSPAGVKKWSCLLPGLRRLLDRPPLSDFTSVRRLAVLRPDGMGDIILTTGMLRELRRQLPSTHITLICQTQWTDWMRTCPWVDSVVDVDTTSSGALSDPKRGFELLRFIKRIWPLELEILIQPGTVYWYVASRSLAWFSGAPVRLCWEDPDAGVDAGAEFHTHTLHYPNSLHETEKCFRMLETIGLAPEGRRLETWWTPDNARSGDEIARNARNGRRKLIALGLAASEERKRWPKERWLEVIRDVSAQNDVAFLAFGGTDVAETCRWLIERAPGKVAYAGNELPLGDLWNAISRCDLFVGNDTGFMHMAAAARVPVVVVIGVPQGAPAGTRGDVSQTGPYGTVSKVVRPTATGLAFAELNAALVSADAVTQATLDLLSSSHKCDTLG
jgi:ADP-heptose:LPS heptosyltransferase